MSQTKPNRGTVRKRKQNGENNVTNFKGTKGESPVASTGIEVAERVAQNKKAKLDQFPAKEFTADTNVPVSFAGALLSFVEHDVRMPWHVLLELDKFKVGLKTENMLTRMAINLMLRLVEGVRMDVIHEGIPLIEPGTKAPKNRKVGKLFFNVPTQEEFLQGEFDGSDHPDLIILREFIKNRNTQLKKKSNGSKEKPRKKNDFIFISRDKMARLFALLLGIPAQDFRRVSLDEKKVLTDRLHYFPNSFWNNCMEEIPDRSATGNAQKSIRVFKNRAFRGINVNEFIVLAGDAGSPERHFRVIKKVSPEVVHLRELKDYRKKSNALRGVVAWNEAQNRGIDVLFDPDVPVVLLYGDVGTSKTFLAELAGYYQMMQFNRYRSIVAARVPVPVGKKELAEVPGGVEEKMRPWLQGFYDNMTILAHYFTRDMFPEATSKKPMPFEELIQSLTGNTNKQKGKKGGAKNGSENKDVSIDYDLCFGAIQGWMKGRSEVVHPSTIRSASFFDQYVILDEAQDARRDVLKAFLTRFGKGFEEVLDRDGKVLHEATRPKLVITGSVQQIDNHIADGDSAFARLIADSVGQESVAQVMLTECTRDPVVKFFNKIL